ncbi:extracellular matrix-binding protein ebh-like isoform X1 [Lytechinus variegatus]|uniref:extracellular matrix-binding protein ebh-like isoform X1 n=1 Tax=Lytechinus variegatus TaxID=7654 RepID=UPI001BB0E384|nr:extracellular matrix-binding protein ebh-like isoform X1 [Lytechinus variegatus]
MATMTEINFAELIDLSLGTPEVVNYKGLRVLLAAIVSKLGVTSVNLELNEGDKKEINEVRDAQSKAKEHGTTPTRPSTGTGTGRLETNFTDIDKSKSIAITDSSRDGPVPSKDKVIQDIEQKMSKIEGQLSALNALPSNQSLMSRSGSSDDGTKKTPVSDMWQLMQCQKTAAANEEGVSKLMSMVEDIMRELSNMNQQLQDHTNNLSNLQDKHANLASDIEKINEYNKTVETRLSSLEASSGQQDKIDDLNKLIEELRNQLALLPQVEEIVTWPDFEAALKGAYKEPIDHSDSAMQTVPSEHSRVQTAPLNHASAQTTTPIPPTPSPPPSRPVSSRSMRSAVSSASLHPTQEIQRVLRELGELTGKHNSLEGRVQTLEDLMSKKADMSEVEALLSQWNVPGDLANKLAELEEGLNHLRDSKAKLDALEERLRSQSDSCAVTFEDLAALRQDLEQAISDLAEAQDALARDVSNIGTVEPSSQGDNGRDNESFQKLQDALAQLQAEVDKLNTSYIHLVDEHNVKQKHIDALYTFVDRLQENKADKEHVIMEIDVKADKRALDNKVSRSHFDGAVDELSKNLSEVMDKLSGHKTAWDSAVGELKLDIDNKLDRMELDPLKSYLDNRIKSVSSKYVKKEVETGEDAAGFRKPLQKFHCISCDRPLDMAPQAPIASLPESRGLPSNRTGRPYTTFELEQIRAAQKKIALSIPPENDLPLIEGTQSLVPGELMRLRHTRQMTEYLRGCSPHVQRWRGAYQDVPDYFVASRSCGGSHTMTFPHRRITRVAQTTNMVTTTEDIAPVINGRIEADIQGQDGHIYKARLDTGHMTERLPTLTQPKGNMRAKSPRVSSARGRRSHPPSRQAPEPLDNTTLQPNGIPVPHSSTAARAPNRPTSGRPGSGNKPPSTSSGGRGSPVTAPANTEVEAGQPPPPTPRDAPPEAITVPQPPLEATSDQS